MTALAAANVIAARALFETLASGFLDVDTETAIDQVTRYWVPYDPAVDSDDSSSSYTSSSDERSAARRPVDLYNILQTMDCALELTVATLVCT